MQDSELKQKTAKGMLWGVVGNGGMQLLSLLFGIFLSRILSPTDYGVVGALTIFIALAGILSESGFMLALVNKRDIHEDDYNSVFWFNLVVSMVCYAVLFAAAPLVARFYAEPQMTSLLRFLSLGFVISATASAPTAYLFRNLRVKERSYAQVGAMVVSGVVGLICAVGGMGYWALAIQNVLYIAVNATLLWWQTGWRPAARFEFWRIRQMLPFSLKQLAVGFFNNVNANFFPVLLGRFYGMWPTGCYTQGSKWTQMGANTVKGMVESVGQPVLREASEDADRLQRVFCKMLSFTAFISIPCMLGLGLVSHEVIVLTVTEKWLECVPIMQTLCVWGACIPIVSLYGNLFNSINRPGVYMWNTILPGILQVGALLATFRLGIQAMVVIYVCINVLWLGVWQLQARRICHFATLRVIASVLPTLFVTLVSLAVAYVSAAWTDNLVLSLVIKVVVAVAVYVLFMWLANREMLAETLYYLRRRNRQ